MLSTLEPPLSLADDLIHYLGVTQIQENKCLKERSYGLLQRF